MSEKNTMEFDEIMRGRRSIRKFLDVPIEFDKLMDVFEAARWAPSAGNIQGWRFVLVRDHEMKEKIAYACYEQYWMVDAPFFVVVFSVAEKYKDFYGERGSEVYSYLDAGAAIQNLLLKAHEQGLGACWVGAFDEDALHEILAAPSKVRIVGVIPIGYPDEKPPAPTKEKLVDLVFLDYYEARIENVDALFNDYSNIIDRKVSEMAHRIKKKTNGKSLTKDKLKELVNKIRNMKLFSDKELEDLEKQYE